MTALEVFLVAFAAQCAVKVLEIAGRALREWFFTVPDGCPERPVLVAPAVSDCSMCTKRPGKRGDFHGCSSIGKPCIPAD